MSDEPKFSQERYDICMKCAQLNPIGMCNKCGCVVLFKVKLRGSACPIGKWSAISMDRPK